MPSVELQAYLEERAGGADVLAASERSGIATAEAVLIEKDIERGNLALPHARAGAGARVREGQSEEETMDGVTTTIRVGDGPELPINLDNIDDPANGEANAAIAEAIGNAVNGDAETAAAQKLRLFIERVERLDAGIKGLNEDKSNVFSEMKSDGFDTKTVKTIIKLRKMDSHARQEAAALLETYARAVGLQHALAL